LLEHHGEVVVLFHELGHGMHDLVSKTRYARFHGASFQDFNEVPSQMLEQWCWLPGTLRAMSLHYSRLSTNYAETWRKENARSALDNLPDAMPDDLFAGFSRSRQYSFLNRTLGVLNISLFYLALNTRKSTDTEIDTTKLWHETSCRTFGFDMPEEMVPMHATQASQISSPDMYIYLVSVCLS
jgi:metallopeptidase MepB